MKAALALAGVGIFGAAVWLIARGRRNVPANTSALQANGTTQRPITSKQIAASLLTSQNIASLGGLVSQIGGAVIPAAQGGSAAPGWDSSGIVVAL